MSDSQLSESLLQKLEEKVTALLVHLDEATTRIKMLEQEISGLRQDGQQLRQEREQSTGRLKTLLELLDETIKPEAPAVSMSQQSVHSSVMHMVSEQKEAEVA